MPNDCRPDPLAYKAALNAVRAAARQARELRILDLFEQEPDRLERLSFETAGLYVDLSRHRLPARAWSSFERLVGAADLVGWRRAMFAGDPINLTEERAVLHVALRASGEQPFRLGAVGEDLMPEIGDTLARMAAFSDRVRDGSWRGAEGHLITDVVNVGIGGSQLGPFLACDALARFGHPRLRVHFLSNIDPDAWDRLAERLDPKRTLAIVASKSWRTIETARNAQAVRRWLLAAGVGRDQLRHHLVGVTANPTGAREFGLANEGIFPFRDWVGGRFSLWSAIGLPVMLQIGPEAFAQMLAGAREMDSHFLETQWDRNIPVMMALLSLWNADALGSQTEAVIPYSQALARLPAYLQQLQMESNGKRVDVDGNVIPGPPAPVIWGEPGTDAQHSFFQSLHQGLQPQPVDFVLVRPTQEDPEGRGRGLLANALAQAEALLRGRPDPENPHRHYPGNRPSTTILLDRLDPRRFGALVALYEHKTASLGWLIRINSFDQWGVELGKEIAAEHEKLLANPDRASAARLDPSTAELLRRLTATAP
ncbi:MAG: glucose-6-phosphate isomerase [Burkholderiaceae bacterium]|nr:glucose-6-phosphate isomerase [Burkholderiaceae bacterium]